MTQPMFSQILIISLASFLLAISPVWAQSPTPEAPATAPATTTPTATAPAAEQVIEGIAVNHLGAGIAGARVRFESLDASEDDAPLATATTGQTGDIRVHLPRAIHTAVRVRIIKEGYAPWVQELDLTDESQQPWIDCTMEGAAKLTGVVRDRLFNEPVKDAVVHCETGGLSFETKTDAHGAYSFNTISYGQVGLRVTAKGFAVEQKYIRVLSEEADADFELGPERKLQLTLITDDEKPAPGVTVEAIPLPNNGYVTATTGPDGKVTLGGISESTEALLLRFNGPRYIQMKSFDVRMDLRLPAESDNDHPPPASMPAIDREFTVHVAAKLKGAVTDAKTGEPVVGVRVIAGREFRSDAPMTWTTLDGTYELEGLPPGLNVISYQHGQYATTIEEIYLDQEQTATKNVRMNPGQTVAGKVVDKDGHPVEQVFVTADEWHGHSTLGLRGITDKDGAFSFINAPAGEIVFSFVKPGSGAPITQTLKSGKSDYSIVLDTNPVEVQAAAPPPRMAKIDIGKPVPDMTLVALDGATYKLSQLRGKYVFLDIWATWCGPCMGEIEHVKALRAAMKSRTDFVLIGVSLDTDRDALKAALQQHGIDWPQICGPKSGAREAFEMLDGVAIPYTALIAPDGTLIAQELRGEGLPEAVKAAMTKPPETRPASQPG